MIPDQRLEEIILSRPYPFNFFEAREMACELKAMRERNRRMAEAVLEGNIARIKREYSRSYLDDIKVSKETEHSHGPAALGADREDGAHFDDSSSLWT